MQVLKDPEISSTFNRKKIQKRHSVASCLKNVTNVQRPPLKRRVSFSKEKTLHLISKQKQNFAPSPGFFNELENAKKDASNIKKHDDFEDLQEPEILDETMAIELTGEFSTKFLEFPDDDNTLCNLVEQDDSLPLPSARSYSDSLDDDDTNSSNGSTSEITFLGGKPLPGEETDDIDLLDLNDVTESIMDLEQTGEFFAPDPDDASTGDVTMNLDDDDFSLRFNILDNLSQKLEIGTTLTEPISDLIAADIDDTTIETQDEQIESEKITFDELDEDEKTENFLLDDNTENLPSAEINNGTNNLSELLCFSGVPSNYYRETPCRTPLNLNRQQQPIGPISVDEFLSRIHIQFRIFDSIRKNSVCVISNDEYSFLEDELFNQYLESSLIIKKRNEIFSNKNQKYENDIINIKEDISMLTNELSKSNPKCFNFDLSSLKQLKQSKKIADINAKVEWYNERINIHQSFNEYLDSISNELQNEISSLNKKLTEMEFPITEKIFLDDIDNNSNDNQIEKQEDILNEIMDEYDILLNLPGWKLTKSSEKELQFVFENDCKLSIQFQHSILTSSFTLIPGIPRSSIKRSLLSNIDTNKYLNMLCTMKDVPNILDNISLWIGRTDDFIEECNRINEMNPNHLIIDLDTPQSDTERTTINMKFKNMNEILFFKDMIHNESNLFELSCSIDIKSYPNDIHFNCSNENITQKLENILQKYPSDTYTFGRFELICSSLLN